MDKGVRGWIVNTARENFWRVQEQYDFDDLVQEGYLRYTLILKKYPGLNEKQHMALLKTAFRNRINDLSSRVSRLPLVRETDLSTPIDFLREGEDPEQDPDLGFIIRELPPAILRVLTRLHAEGRGHPFRRRLDHTRETTNERLCRLAGLDPTQRNVRRAVRAYLDGLRLHPAYD